MGYLPRPCSIFSWENFMCSRKVRRMVLKKVTDKSWGCVTNQVSKFVIAPVLNGVRHPVWIQTRVLNRDRIMRQL